MSTVWLIAIGFLTLIGIIEVIETIKRWVMRGKNQGQFLICVPVGGEDPALEYKIRSLVQRMNESDFAAGEPVYLVDVGMDGYAMEICRRMGERYQQIHVCNSGQLKALMESGLICKEQGTEI